MKNADLSRLADSVIVLCKNSLCAELPPLYRAVSNFPHIETDEEDVYTDGNCFYYSPKYILNLFESDKNAVNRLILHSLFHCLFLHIYKSDFKQRDLWDLSCDICVEKVTDSCRLACTDDKNNAVRKSILAELSGEIKNFTAENVYNRLSRFPLSEERFLFYKSFFSADRHYGGYDFSTENSEDFEEVEARSIYKFADNRAGIYQNVKKDSKSDSADFQSEDADPEKRWREIAKKIIRDVETSPSVCGVSKGFDVSLLQSVTRDKHDYSAFLKKFVQTNEQLEINDDEFDYIYYTYGLGFYGNIPLIEPLEYSENAKIRRLVIGIDTSGSVYGDPVKKFIEKTYSILKSTDFFGGSFEIHIIQCDCEIQSVDIIRSQDELEKFTDSLTLRGFGGTDFRPVFHYAENLLQSEKSKTFNGVIYFTDGDGIFPEKPPKFKTAFLIHDNGFDKKKMPSWAIPLYIETDKL